MKCCKMEIVCEEKRNDQAMYLDHIFSGCASEGDWALCALPPTAFMLRMVSGVSNICHSTSEKLLLLFVFVSEYLFGYGAWLRFSFARGLFFSQHTARCTCRRILIEFFASANACILASMVADEATNWRPLATKSLISFSCIWLFIRSRCYTQSTTNNRKSISFNDNVS